MPSSEGPTGLRDVNHNLRLSLAALALPLLFAVAGCDGGSEAKSSASAKAQLAANDTRSAVVTLKAALQKHPESPELRALLGKALLNGGDAVAASVELNKALELGHPELDTVPSLSKALVGSGRFKEVTDRFSSTVLNNPRADAELRTQLAWAHGAQGQQGRMIEQVKAALAADPTFGPALVMDARFKAGRGEIDEAIRGVEAALKSDPKLAEAWHFKGDLLRQGKDDDNAAIEAYRKAIASDAQYLPAYLDLMSVLQGRKDTAGMKAVLADAKKAMPGRLAVALAEAQVVFSEGDLRRTRELLQGVLRSSRDNIRALQMVGVVELASGSFNQAETYFSRVLQLAPDSVNARRMLALTYVRGGQPAKALTTLQPLLDAKSPKPAVLAMAAEAHLQAGNAARAESLYQQAARIDPKDPQVRTALAMTRITRGDAAGGFAELEALAAQDPTPQGALTIITAHIRKGDVDGALKAIDRLEAKSPSQPIAHDMRGRVLLMRKDVAGARASFEKAVAMRADYFPAAESLAVLDLGENKLDQAKARFEAMLKVDPKYLRATLALAELNTRLGTPKADVAKLLTEAIQSHPTEAQPRLMLAELHLAHDEVKAAMSVAQDANTTIPDDPRVLDVLGRAQWKAGEMQQATTSFRKASVIDPKLSLPYLRLAALHQASDNATAAMQNYRRVLELAPGHAVAQQGVVDLAIKTKSYDEAMALATNVQRQQPRDGIGHSLEGDVLGAQKKWPAAVSAYRLAVQKTPSTDAAVKLHTALLEAKQRAEAEGFAKSWRTNHPRDARFTMHLGDVALVSGELAAAEALYTEVLALQPKNDVAMNNLAWLLMRQNKPGALEYAQKANAMTPDKPQFMDTLASVLASDKQFAKALDLQKKVVAMAPDYNNGRLNLARIAIQAGDTKLAKAELEKLSWLGDKFPAQAEVVQLLKGVQ